MKKFIVIATLVFFSFSQSACKKDKDPVTERYIRFTYNGQEYEASWPSSGVRSFLILPELIFANFYGLHISRPDIFNGDIIISIASPNQSGLHCAYLRPAGTNVAGSNCSSLNDNGAVIDSVRTYWLESGSLNYGYSNCKELTNVTVPGQKLCTVTGTFSFILTNKNNQKIVVTNGRFSDEIKRYN